MVSRIKLKSTVSAFGMRESIIVRSKSEHLYLEDPTGRVATLLQLLRERPCTLTELMLALSDKGVAVDETELSMVISQLDRLQLLDEARSEATLSAETSARHLSNLRYYEMFSSLSRTNESFHAAAANAHILLLGACGLGSGVLQSLLGLGLGSVTLVDFDVVEVENLARQFVYGENSVGMKKVHAAATWASQYSSGTLVEPVDEMVTSAARIIELGAAATAVVCAIDQPADIRLMANQACFSLGVPMVTAGLSSSSLMYWSVKPGTSPCLQCLELHRRDESVSPDHHAHSSVIVDQDPVNRATGPLVQILAGFVTMELMRYVTGTDAPVAAATYNLFDIADGMRHDRTPWAFHPECPLCAAEGVIGDHARP